MRNYRRVLTLLATTLACVVLPACGGGSNSSGSSTGSMTLSITDSPVDTAQSVVVVFTGVELKPVNGNSINVDFATPKSIDLLTLQGGKTTDLFANQTVPAGDYEWMRLKVMTDPTANDASHIVIDGNTYNLMIPSGAETGLKLVRGFTVAQGSTTGFVIDFDLRKSVVAPPGQAPNYFLKPALTLLDEMQVGTIAGTVHLAALVAAQLAAGAPVTDCHTGLYLFSGATATPDDFDRDASGDDDGGTDPIYLQPVANDGVVTDVSFSIPFVEAGKSYALAATCDFDKDGMDSNDYRPNAASGEAGYQTMRWTAVNNVTVTAGATTTVSVP
jgi:Domain of unknown function (DUF4382)